MTRRFELYRCNRLDCLHLFHQVLTRLCDLGGFSSRQYWQDSYLGAGPLHRYARTHVRGLLSRSVTSGILERDAQIAHCPFAGTGS